MPVSAAFRVQRLALTAGELTPIRPLMNANSVSIGNPTNQDLQLHTKDDGSEYLIIGPGWERMVEGSHLWLYKITEVAFWLKSVSGGTPGAVITWVP